MVDPIQQAADLVSYDDYARRPDGALLTQTTSPGRIAMMLRWLDVPSGARVLEIGTGSGYSTAVLSHLVGPTGLVISIDVDPSLTDHAADRLVEHGIANVAVLTGDGAKGVATHAPYDRVVAWATPDAVPGAWVEQATPGTLIVTPVQLTPLANTPALLRARVTDQHALVAEHIEEGGFVYLHSEVLTQWAVPPRNVDPVGRDDDGEDWWLSAEWMREPEAREDAAALLRTLLRCARCQPRPLDDDESVGDLRAYLLAARPHGLAAASLGRATWWIGCTRLDGVALLRLDSDRYVEAGDPAAAAVLRGWIDDWRGRGRPGFANLRPYATKTAEGWQVRACLAPMSPEEVAP